MALAPERQRLVELMGATVADQTHHSNWRYRAVRPQAIPPHYIPAGYVEADCSDGCRDLCRWANIPDPAGNVYAPYGNSSSIWAHLPHISLSEADPGDIVTFGYRYGEKHAAMLWERTGTGAYDWTVWNHGRPGQPQKRTLMQEVQAHAGMSVTCCRIPVVDPPPTPQDRLRAMTGFYAWVAWRLGEGPWRKHKPRDPEVRPNVPAIVSPAWWVRLQQFLLNRKKANA